MMEQKSKNERFRAVLGLSAADMTYDKIASYIGVTSRQRARQVVVEAVAALPELAERLRVTGRRHPGRRPKEDREVATHREKDIAKVRTPRPSVRARHVATARKLLRQHGGRYPGATEMLRMGHGALYQFMRKYPYEFERMYDVCERLQVLYTFGLSTNAVLKRATKDLLQKAVDAFDRTKQPVRLFDPFLYRAKSWKNHRRVIAKAECNTLGTNLRFVVTNRPGAVVLPETCYDGYVQRGESENRHKELKNGLAGDRLSCHRFLANYFRLQLHCAALNLLIRLRPVIADPPALAEYGKQKPDQVPVNDPSLPVEALAGQERRRYHNYRRRLDPLGQGHIDTWRTMLIKVAGEVTRSVRRIVVTIPAHWPHLNWFRKVCQRIAALPGRAQVST